MSVTLLEAKVLEVIAASDFFDGPVVADKDVWFWPDEIAKEVGIGHQAVGGVCSSLQAKKLINIFMDGADSVVRFTEAGFEVVSVLLAKKEEK